MRGGEEDTDLSAVLSPVQLDPDLSAVLHPVQLDPDLSAVLHPVQLDPDLSAVLHPVQLDPDVSAVLSPLQLDPDVSAVLSPVQLSHSISRPQWPASVPASDIYLHDLSSPDPAISGLNSIKIAWKKTQTVVFTECYHLRSRVTTKEPNPAVAS
jgi:hypothetical protein